MLKLLHPHDQISDPDSELRQRVREQISREVIVPALPNANRIQRVTLPRQTECRGGDRSRGFWDQGCIIHSEMQATKGHGRIVPLGSIQKVMWASIEAAAPYIKANHAALGITAEW